MEQDGQVNRTTRLVGHPGKLINIICEKISEHMEPRESAFTIHIIAIQADQPIK